MKRRWDGPWDQISMVIDGQDTVVKHGDVIDDELVAGTLNPDWWPPATDPIEDEPVIPATTDDAPAVPTPATTRK